MTEFHIVSAHWNEDMEWLKKSEYSYSICDKIDNPNYEGTGDCDVNKNTGNECSSYLQYILNNYDNLPSKMAFIHGHKDAWHQQHNMSDTLEKAKDSNLNFGTLNGTVIDDEAWQKAICTFKKEFPEFSSRKEWTDKIDMSGSSVKSDCCSQFVVDSDRVKRFPKEAWEALQREVLQADDRSSKCFHLERMWSPLFGEPAYNSDPMQTYIGPK